MECNDGTWSKLTLKCEKKSCGNAGELPNGQFKYEGNSFIGDKVYAVCNKGYTVKGLNYLICKRTGWSGEFPSCEVSSEGEVTCSTPAVANSVSSGGDASVYRVGDNVMFNCRQGFQLHGAQEITCGPGGQWQTELPRCLPLPTPDKTEQADTTPQPDKQRPSLASGCGVPESFSASNAHLADKYVTKTSFASGDRVHYACDVGYTQAGGSRYRRCNKGKWTPLFLRCERKPCGSAGEIANGQFTYTGVDFGDTATAVCDDGYRLVGQAIRNCLSNGWDGRTPVCEAVYCGEPPVSNAELNGNEELSYTYGSVVQYQCQVGTLQGPREIWCTKDGTWSNPPPTCEEIACPPPKVFSASWAGAGKQLYQYRETISVECYPGYRRTGPRMMTCGRDGQWYPGFPRCTRTAHRSHWKHQ